MGDAALSQEEIDSLLAGLDGGSGPAPASQPRGGAAALSPQESQAFKGLLDLTVGAQAQNISVITGLPATVQPPQLEVLNRDGFLRELPEEVLAVSVPFAGSLPGDHVFVLSKTLALAIASNANNDQGLAELDEMSISTVQECISNLTGTEINVLAERTANRGIQSGVAEGSFGPKAMVRVPAGDMVRAAYQIQVGEGAPERIVEVFTLPFVKDVLASIGASAPSQAGGQAFAAAPAQAGGMAMAAQGFGGGPAYQMGGMQAQAAGVGAYGVGMNPPNVQPVQFASLQLQQASHESGNIGLIMDVYMEMTVELGRTRKLIKEILGMGEGTIIELDKLAGEPVDILVNHKLIAKGEVVVIDENFGVRVTEIVSPMERMSDLT